ncbi:MAG: hypothetical protein AAF683_12475, partial [Pseudomonadota bacterium]
MVQLHFRADPLSKRGPVFLGQTNHAKSEEIARSSSPVRAMFEGFISKPRSYCFGGSLLLTKAANSCSQIGLYAKSIPISMADKATCMGQIKAL